MLSNEYRRKKTFKGFKDVDIVLVENIFVLQIGRTVRQDFFWVEESYTQVEIKQQIDLKILKNVQNLLIRVVIYAGQEPPKAKNFKK